MINRDNYIYHVCIYSALILFLWALCLIFSSVHLVGLINGIHSPEFDFIFLSLTNLGDGLIIIPFVVVLLFQRFGWAIGLVLNGIIQGTVVYIFKRILFPHSLRPISFLDTSVVHLIPGVSIHKWMTFPSGHTVTAFGVCIFLSLCYRNKWLSLLLVSLAIIVGLSRVYLLQHFLLDVVAGAAIGASIGLLSYYIIESRKKPRWLHQRMKISLKAENPDPKFS
jgi:membrane-associated phospholipid phosphatase